MKKQKSQYYVVWEGRETGIFSSWNDCRKRVEGHTGAKYKGFPSLVEAQIAQADGYLHYLQSTRREKSALPARRPGIGVPVSHSISVDAACSGNPGVLEYRGVRTDTGEEIFHRGPFPEGTTNIGEFLAIVTGLAWLKQNNLNLPLYSDSRNGILWVKQKRINTRLVRTPKNDEIFRIIGKALEWLHNNHYESPVLKWETADWGEIPADFGRK
jgi:ribonuclease HI